MINFIEGRIKLGAKSLLAFSSYDHINTLTQEGLIEKRADRGGDYYYVEAVEDGMRFGVFVSLREKKVEWLRLHWLDSPMQGWDDVSEKAVMDEYRLLCTFVEKNVGAPPDNKGNRQRAWRLKWGQLKVCYDMRAFQADIFMKPQ